MLGEKHKLLIVEDNRETQLIIKALFRNRYHTQVVDNVTDAISQLSEINFDLILLDLNLNGDGNGKTLLIKIRKDEKNHLIPVVIISAYDIKPEDEKFFSENANSYIPKPFNKKILLQTVEKLLLKN
ncbi:MAG: response regulator [Ignavibacteriaceae bacterium]|jgi:CheY-like chemotaxis protein|nr:response regulator [Ignavibacteriaceae bacterium]MCU0364509.1 response regulator [Ignavibacteriaceae bacterium]MCU0406341.1 response regulator [Ignavibacteriaceae bacterium]MCU0414272.1 response regulator [Ignavibacteriaceae bacterium]